MATAKKAAAKKKAPAKNDALSLLQHDHDEVKALFQEYESLVDEVADDEEKEALAQQICAMLTVHAQIEEEIFYPALRDALDEQDLLDEAEVEHAMAKELIAQIESMAAADELYDAKVRVLGEYVAHHVKEEQDEMFKLVKQTELDLDELGQSLMARKQELMLEMGLEPAEAP